jgi:hypothetical protein
MIEVKKTTAGLLALSLISSASMVSAKADHSEHASGHSVGNSHVERQITDVVRNQVRSVVQDQVNSIQTQVQTQATSQIQDQIKNLTKQDIIQAAKDQAKTELKKYKSAEIKQILQQKVQQLAQNYVFNHPEQFAELGQYYQSLGDNSIKTFVNGKALSTDVPPFVKDGRTLVPVRAIVASLKANVQWDPSTQTVTIQRGDTTVKLQIDSNEYLVNGQPGTLDVPATLKNGRTFLPLRAISQLLGAKVDYESEGNIAVVEDDDSNSTTTDTSSTQTGTTGTDTTTQTSTTSTDTSTQTGTTGTDTTTQTVTTSTYTPAQ